MLVILNDGQFKGASLDKFTEKQYSGEVIPKWYEEKNYRAIEQYIQEEAREFIKLYQMLKKRIPKIIQVEEILKALESLKEE